MFIYTTLSPVVFFFYCYGDHRDLHVLTHSFPTLRSSDLRSEVEVARSGRPVGKLFAAPSHGDHDERPGHVAIHGNCPCCLPTADQGGYEVDPLDRKSTRLNSSH